MADPRNQVRFNGPLEYDAGRKIDRNTQVHLECIVTIDGNQARMDTFIPGVGRNTKRITIPGGLNQSKLKKHLEGEARKHVKEMLPSGVAIRKFPPAR